MNHTNEHANACNHASRMGLCLCAARARLVPSKPRKSARTGAHAQAQTQAHAQAHAACAACWCSRAARAARAHKHKHTAPAELKFRNIFYFVLAIVCSSLPIAFTSFRRSCSRESLRTLALAGSCLHTGVRCMRHGTVHAALLSSAARRGVVRCDAV